jgi:predicted transcriptional regulator
MADQNPTGRAPRDPASPAEQDRQTEGVVLALLLEEHPARLTTGELALILNAFPSQGWPEDTAKRAIRELVGAGLVHRDGHFLAPSRAALYFDALEMD